MSEINGNKINGNKFGQIRRQTFPHIERSEETGINQQIHQKPTIQESSDFLGKIMNHEISMFDLEDQKVFMSLSAFDSDFIFLEGIVGKILLQNNDYKLGIHIDGQKYKEVLEKLGLVNGDRFHINGYKKYIVIKLQKINNSIKAYYTDMGSGLEISVLIKLAN